jgi:hypothetical protein
MRFNSNVFVESRLSQSVIALDWLSETGTTVSDALAESNTAGPPLTTDSTPHRPSAVFDMSETSD